MPDAKISELPLANTPLAGTEEQEIVQGGVNKRVAVSNIGGVSSVNTRTGAVTGVQDLVNTAVVITDAASMDLTAIKHTLTTSSATRTFTISYTGDDISIKVILNATSSVFTFPAGALCVSEGIASGNNTCPLAGVSGDVYAFAIKHWGSAVYTVVAKNTGQ